MRMIRVTGKGKIKVHPDTTRIVITLRDKNMDYGKTLKPSAEGTEELKDLLESAGFLRTDLKTLSFDVDTEYETYKVKDEYKRHFTGYRFTHVLKVEFDSDNQRLGRVLTALAGCRLHPEFRLEYTVRDPEAVKNALLGRAVQDAVAKAGVLSSAAGVKLGEIESLDYSWGEIDLEIRPMGRNLNEEASLPMCADGCNPDIEPDDIEAQDTVTAVWKIE